MKKILELLIIISLTACSNGMLAVPSGTVTLTHYASTDDGTVAAGVPSFTVTNTGSYPISKTTISYCVKTSAESYYKTVTFGVSLPVGKTFTMSDSLLFYSLAETSSASAVTIESYYFE